LSLKGFLKNSHHQIILINRDTSVTKYTSNFKLIDSHFIVSCFEGNTKL